MCNHKVNEERLYQVGKAGTGVAMSIYIVEALDRICTLNRDDSYPQRSVGYGGLYIAKSDLAIAHISKRLKPHMLHEQLVDIINRRRNETSSKQNSDHFMREVSTKAENFQ